MSETEAVEAVAVADSTIVQTNGNAEPPADEQPAPLVEIEVDPDSLEHSEYYKTLIETGVNKATAFELENLVKSGQIAESELDERALNGLKEFEVRHVREVLKEFATSTLSHVQNKSAYLCGLMKTYRQRMRAMAPIHAAGVAPIVREEGGPNEEKIKAILDRTGYSLDVTTGQRKYGGPPPGWEGANPGPGHEVFIGKIPRDMFEDELVPILEKCGKIWDFRLMIDSLTGKNRGYGFCTFCEKSGAQEAVKILNDYDLGHGKQLKVNISVANVRLFAGNIPKQKSKEEIIEEFSKLSEGLVDVIVYTNPGEPHKKNRGFAFLEYESHKHASAARRKFLATHLRVWGCDIIIDWAEPQDEPTDEVMSQVKVLYVRGLLPDVTEEMLKEKFEPYGAVERTKKVKDYAFIHFASREPALQAMNDLNNQKLGESTMEISLAKPQSDKKKQTLMRMREDGPPMPGPHRGGFGGARGGWAPPLPPPRPGYRPGYSYDDGSERERSDTRRVRDADYDYPPYDDYPPYVPPYDDYAPYHRPYDDYPPYPPPRSVPPARRLPPPAPPAWRAPLRGAPRGAAPFAAGRGGRGAPRGAPRGGRGAPRGGAPPAGMKRPGPGGEDGRGGKKPRGLMEDSWGVQPIAQQPLGSSAQSSYAAQADNKWYQDSW